MTANLEGLKKEIVSYKEKVSKSADKPKEKRALRKSLKRIQRKYKKQLPKTDQDRLNEANKILAMVTTRLGDMQKITKKQQGDPKMQSLKKKVKSLTRKVKILTAKLQPKDHPSVAQTAQAQPAQTPAPVQTPPAEAQASEQKT